MPTSETGSSQPLSEPAPVRAAVPLAQLDYRVPVSVAPVSGLAIASMILGIVTPALFCTIFPLPIASALLALVLGFKAGNHIRLGERSGAGFANTGIILGFIFLVVECLGLVAVVIAFFARK